MLDDDDDDDDNTVTKTLETRTITVRTYEGPEPAGSSTKPVVLTVPVHVARAGDCTLLVRTHDGAETGATTFRVALRVKE